MRSPDPSGRELVVLSWGGPWDRALRLAVSDPFEQATGIAVRHQKHVGLEIPDQLVTAARGGARPPCDVVWSTAVAAMRAARDDVCDPLTPDEVPNLTSLHSRAKPDGFDGWPLVMVCSLVYVLVYQREPLIIASPKYGPRAPEVGAIPGYCGAGRHCR